MRFSELAQLYAKEGCKMLIYPGGYLELLPINNYLAAFNMVTGPAHWELLQRGRALDNQLYVATVSPARNPGTYLFFSSNGHKESTYQAWGHSTVVSPWGDILTTTEHDPTIIYADIGIQFPHISQLKLQISIVSMKLELKFQSQNKKEMTFTKLKNYKTKIYNNYFFIYDFCLVTKL